MNTFLHLFRGLANLIEVLLDFCIGPIQISDGGKEGSLPADHLDKLEATRLI